MPYYDAKYKEHGETEKVNYTPRVYAYVRDGVIKIANSDNQWHLSALEAEDLAHDLRICLKAPGVTGSPSISRKRAGIAAR